MRNVESPTRPAPLEERLKRGAELLFELEQRGETGAQYREWLRHFEQLLAQYEATPQPA